MSNQIEIAENVTAMLEEAGIAGFTSHLSYAEIAEKCKEAAHGLKGFAKACYDQNNVAELVDAMNEGAAKNMENWNIDEEEWETAIKTALLAKAFDEIYDDLMSAEELWNEMEGG